MTNLNPKSVLWFMAFFLFMQSFSVWSWPKTAYRNMVHDTLRVIPPRLSQVLISRDDAIYNGMINIRSDTATVFARNETPAKIPNDLLDDVNNRIERIVLMLNQHNSFDDIGYELGHLLRIAIDVCDPGIVGSGEPELQQVISEYYRFVDSNLNKIPFVYDKRLPSPVAGAYVRELLTQAVKETSDSVTNIADSFWKKGRLVSASALDLQSVPYAEASLSYSRGVTAAAYLWVLVWSKANGDFTGYRFGLKNN